MPKVGPFGRHAEQFERWLEEYAFAHASELEAFVPCCPWAGGTIKLESGEMNEAWLDWGKPTSCCLVTRQSDSL